MATSNLLRQSANEQWDAGFKVAYAATLSNMLQIAAFIANDPEVQQEFLAGKLAVEKEGGRNRICPSNISLSGSVVAG